MLGLRRLAVLVALLAVTGTGCAQVSPVAPAAESAAPEMLEIGTDGSSTLNLVAGLYAAALQAGGQPAAVVEVVPGTETLAVADHSPAAMPVYAATLLRQYDTDSIEDGAEVVSALATAVAPDLAVLETGKVDGGLVWAVTMESASAGVADLTALGGWGPDRVLVAPGFAMASPSGVPALSVGYGSAAVVQEVADPVARHDALVEGSADAAGFRRTETMGLADLVELDDPMGVVTPDPLVVLLAADLAEERPDAVLILDAVQQELTLESLAALAQAASQDGAAAAIADWLNAAGLAG